MSEDVDRSGASDGSVDFTALDEFMGYVSRRAEEIGFHYWAFFLSRDTEENLVLAVDCVVETNQGIVRAGPSFRLGEDIAWDMVSPRLNGTMLVINEEIKQRCLEVVPRLRNNIRERWDESASFAPQFLGKVKWQDAVEHGD